MEKLIELLNEYMQPYIKYKGWNVPGRYFLNYDEGADLHEEEVISKRFGFIKWLVENEKIDLDACGGEKTYGNLTVARDCNYTQYERLLMALAIKDEPINFLISILKNV